MTDSETTIAELKELVLRFSQERDWVQFHNPKDLALALVCEVGEILEHFRFRADQQTRDYLETPAARREVGHELADCLWMILRLAEVCQVDLAAALEEKVGLAAIKYPVELSFGRRDKYTTYQRPELGNEPSG